VHDADLKGDIAMTIVAERYSFVIGVDTHAASHTFAVVAAATAALGPVEAFPSTGPGLARAVAWTARHTGASEQALIVVEGTGSYGAAVARAFTAAGYRVVESGPASSPSRRGAAKSDPVDAVAIGRSVLGQTHDRLRQPRADGIGNALRILLNARETITRDRTVASNTLTALARTEPLGVDARRPLSMSQIRAIVAWRGRSSDAIDVAIARTEATRLARIVIDLGQLAAVNAHQLRDLVEQAAPGLLDTYGLGPVNSAAVIVAWSHPGRVRNDAAFAALAGTCPIPASSGNTNRHRLNRGGDRRLNKAIHAIVLTRMAHEPRTKAYVARRVTEGKTRKEAIRCLKRYVTRDLQHILERVVITT
jgi:transposase